MIKRKCFGIIMSFMIICMTACGNHEASNTLLEEGAEVTNQNEVVGADKQLTEDHDSKAESVENDDMIESTEDSVDTNEQLRIEEHDLYMQFLDGEIKTLTDERFMLDDNDYNADCLYYGEYTIDDLIECLDVLQTSRILVSYAFWDFGAEGSDELIVRMENTEPALLRWTGIFSIGADGILYLASDFTDGYRSEANLYDNGYLVISGSNGAASHQTDVNYISESGEMEPCFSLKELWAYSVSELVYDLAFDPYDVELDMDAEYDENFYVRGFISHEGVTFSVDSRSENDDCRQAEAELLDTIRGLGGIETSSNEMDQLFDLSEYESEALTFSEYGSKYKEGSTITSDQVAVDYADEATLSDAEDFDLFIIDDSEYSFYLEFETEGTVTDVNFYNICLEGVSDDGRVTYEATKILNLDSMSYERNVILQTSFPGDTPTLGFSYVDEMGENCYFSISMSGYDGSIVCTREEPFVIL